MGIWYATREDVRTALESTGPADNAQIDRAIDAASRAIDAGMHRRFWPEVDSRSFPWPDPPGRSSTWRLWLDQHELISLSALTVGGVAMTADALLEPQPYGPPFDRIELDRDSSSAYASGDTPQRSIVVAGTFGYRDDSAPAGTSINSISDSQTFLIGDSTTGVRVGVGTLLRLGDERMVVTGRQAVDTGQNTSGTVDADLADTGVAVTDGSAFMPGEFVAIDAEVMRIDGINGNTLIVARAQLGTVLASHASGVDVAAYRQLTIDRAAAGTTAASHSSGAMTMWVPPPLIRSLCIAEAIARRGSESAGAGSAEIGQVSQTPGAGLPGLWSQALTAHGRRARTRAV